MAKPEIEKINNFLKKNKDVKYFHLKDIKMCRAKGCELPATYKIPINGKKCEFCSAHINVFRELAILKKNNDKVRQILLKEKAPLTRKILRNKKK